MMMMMTEDEYTLVCNIRAARCALQSLQEVHGLVDSEDHQAHTKALFETAGLLERLQRERQ